MTHSTKRRRCRVLRILLRIARRRPFAALRYRRALRRIIKGSPQRNPQADPSLAAVLGRLERANAGEWECYGYRCGRWHAAQIARKILGVVSHRKGDDDESTIA